MTAAVKDADHHRSAAVGDVEDHGGDILGGLVQGGDDVDAATGLLGIVFNAKTTADDLEVAYTEPTASHVLTVGLDAGLMGAGIYVTAAGIMALATGAAVAAPGVVVVAGCAVAVGTVVGVYRLAVDDHIIPDYVSEAVNASWRLDCNEWKSTVHAVANETPKVAHDVADIVGGVTHEADQMVAHLFRS